jgi:8-oxo-dGTP diphosphatase
MREWLVGSAIIESAGQILLVRNRRRNGNVDWSPPGGVIDHGETVLEGLTREVSEETGLAVTGWAGPVYEVQVAAEALGWRARIEVWRATGFTGELHVDDPDGIVFDARFVTRAACDEHLDGCHQWVREPLATWLAEREPSAAPLAFRYDVSGSPPELVVSRTG